MDILKALGNLILMNWDNILVVLVFVSVCLYLWSIGKKDRVKDILCKLICEVEDEFGSGKGELKKIEVFNRIYDWMPSLLKIFISRKMLDVWIEQLLQEIKDQLSTNN